MNKNNQSYVLFGSMKYEVWNCTFESIVQLIFSPCVSYFISHKYGTIAFIISDKTGGLDQKERNKLKITVKTEENGVVNLKQICDFLCKCWIKDVIEGYFGRRITNQLLWNSLKKKSIRGESVEQDCENLTRFKMS